MKKQEIVAMLVMDSTMEPVKPTNVQVVDKNGLFYLKFQTVLQEFNAWNRNKRKYMSGPMMESLNMPHIQELRRKKTWMGEAGHPLEDEVKRILTIDPKLCSHKVNDFELKGNLLYGEVETLDNGAYGTQMTKQILQGMEPAFSLRALAPVTKNADGTAIVQQRGHIVCYDWVILPSHNKAYRDETSAIQKIYKNVSDDGNVLTESAFIPVMESQLLDFIKEESVNVNLISNICEVTKESMQLSTDMKNVILREGNRAFHVKIDDKIQHDIQSYMLKL